MFWGISPALDLQEEYIKEKPKDYSEINILIVGGSDARNIIKTLAQSYRHKKVKINIHVVESCPELLARQLLLLSIAMTHPKSLGLQEKTRYFMEMYGNTLLRSTSSFHLISLSKQFIKMITNLEYMREVLPLVVFDKVKYRERDYIEMLLKFWGTGSTNRFDICQLWDGRLRKSLGVRYDCRIGVFDWDFNMRFRDMGGTTVSSQEYKHFRSTGVAFTWLETEVSRPNCSLAAGVIKTGEEYLHRGYLGDIVTGPYVAYGLDCEDKNMVALNNGICLKRSTDITERNLMRMFHELQHGEAFDSKVIETDCDQNLGLVTLAMMDAKLSERGDFECANIQKSMSFIDVEDAKVFFHSSSALEIYPDKAEFQKKFQVLFVGYHLHDKINPRLLTMMESESLVIIEGCKYILDMKKEDIKAFSKDIDTITKKCNCDMVCEFDPMKDSFAKMFLRC